MSRLLIISLLIGFSQQFSTVEDTDYIAGVVEFTPELPTVNWELRTVLHFDNYSRIIQEAGDKDVDILVFPEYTLNNVAFPVIIPHPDDKIVPCFDSGSFDNLVVDLSCLAQQHNLYLSINLSEQEDCTEESQLMRNDTRPCSRLGINRFNTNVVFDRNGTVIARYRKWNLFREGGVNQTATPELSVFETDFGVTFGQFVCFDLLFFEPAIQLIKMGIENFIFPAMWVAELPFLSSTQIFQSWSYRNNVNLITAGTNFRQAAASGSGFFAGVSGDIFSLISSNPMRRLFVAKIPKIPGWNNSYKDYLEEVEQSYVNFNFGRDSIDEFTTESLDTSREGKIKTHLCHNLLCCDFQVNITGSSRSENSYKYRFVSFQGWRSYSGWNYNYVYICGIMACTNNTLDSCGRVFSNKEATEEGITFNSIKITTEFNRIGVLMMPNSLNLFGNPLKTKDFSYRESDSTNYTKEASIELLQPHSDLLTFALYGHDYQTSDYFPFVNQHN
ncbi:unnamed protein product [Diamesa hyperborea]